MVDYQCVILRKRAWKPALAQRYAKIRNNIYFLANFVSRNIGINNYTKN